MRCRSCSRTPLGVEPPPLRAQDPAAVDEEARRRQRLGGRGSGAGPHNASTPDRADAHAEARPAFRRPEAARRDRTRIRRRPEARGVRRADVGARRLGAGGDPEPPRELQTEKRVAYLFISTTSVSSATSPIGSPCCTSDGCRSSARPTSSSTVRTTRTPRRFCPPCRQSTAEGETGSSSRGTSRAPPRCPRDVSSIRRCPRFLGQICIEQEPPLVEVEEGHLMRCHIPIEELRRLQAKDAATV